MEMMIADILVKGLLLTAILYVVARHEADLDFEKAAMVVAGITIGTFVINVAFVQYAETETLSTFILVGVLKFLLSAAFVVFMLMKFCWVRLHKAITAMILFYVLDFAFALGTGLLMAKLLESTDEATDTAVGRYEQNTREAVGMLKEMMGMESELLAAPSAPRAPGGPAALPVPDGTGALAAAEAAAEPAPPPPAPVYKVEALTKKAAEAHDGLRGSRDMLKVTATLTDPGGKRHAVVNGKLVEEGGIVEVEYDKQTYRWKVAQVRPEGVIWEAAGP